MIYLITQCDIDFSKERNIWSVDEFSQYSIECRILIKSWQKNLYTEYDNFSI